MENAGIFYGHLIYFAAIWYILWPLSYSINTVRYCLTNIECKVVLVFCHADSCLGCHSVSPNLFQHAAQLFRLM
jgi:hypothetical protein